jgi:hypothetical protein
LFFFFCFLEKGQKGSNNSSTSTDYGEDGEQNWFYKLWNENVDADDEGDEGELTFYIYIYLHL